MKNTFFLSSNDLGFDLTTLRMLAKQGLKLDLSTGPKGRTEALLVLSKFKDVKIDDLRHAEVVQRHIFYSFVVVDTPEVCEELLTVLNDVQYTTLGVTIGAQALILVASATLEQWVKHVKQYSRPSSLGLLRFLNEVQAILETNGYSQLFEDYKRLKYETLYTLERR